MSRGQRPTLAVAILSSGAAAIDGSIVNVALPAIQRDLGGGQPTRCSGCRTRVRCRAACKNLACSDRPLLAIAPDERDRPVKSCADAVRESGQKGEVDEQPGDPADEAGDMNSANGDNCAEPRDRHHRAQVGVVERPCASSVKARSNDGRRALFGDLDSLGVGG
jgi:hypothetical protein